MRRTDYSCVEPTIHSPAGGGHRPLVTPRDWPRSLRRHRIRADRRESTSCIVAGRARTMRQLRGLLVELQREAPTRSPRRSHSSTGIRRPGHRSATRSAQRSSFATPAEMPMTRSWPRWPRCHGQGRGRTIVVTDDRALADRCRTAGALLRRLDWIEALPWPDQSNLQTGFVNRRWSAATAPTAQRAARP
jgi:hypothetical protein